MSKTGFGIIIAVILLAISLPTAYFALIDASQPAIKSAKEGDTKQFGEDLTNYMYVTILVVFITVISVIIIAKIKGG